MQLWGCCLLLFFAVWGCQIIYRLYLVRKAVKLLDKCVLWGEGKNETFHYFIPDCEEICDKGGVYLGTISNYYSTQQASAYVLKHLIDAHVFLLYQLRKALSPFTPLKAIIFAPTNLLNALGIRSRVIKSNLFKAIVTFIWWAFCFIVTLFSPEIKELIIAFLQ